MVLLTINSKCAHKILCYFFFFFFFLSLRVSLCQKCNEGKTDKQIVQGTELSNMGNSNATIIATTCQRQTVGNPCCAWMSKMYCDVVFWLDSLYFWGEEAAIFVVWLKTFTQCIYKKTANQWYFEHQSISDCFYFYTNNLIQ